MAEVLLFHHAQGQTEGFLACKPSGRKGGDGEHALRVVGLGSSCAISQMWPSGSVKLAVRFPTRGSSGR